MEQREDRRHQHDEADDDDEPLQDRPRLDARRAPRDHRADHRDQHDHHTRIERAFGRGLVCEMERQPRLRRRRPDRAQIRAEEQHFLERAREAERRLHLVIAPQHRQQRQRSERAGDRDRQKVAPRAHEPQHPERHEHRDEDHQVAAGEAVEQPAHREEQQIAAPAPLDVAVQRQQTERHEARPQQLDVRELRGPVRAEAERDAGDPRRAIVLREVTRECVRRQRRGRKGQHVRDVVREHRARTHPLERGGQRRQAEQRFRQREGAGHRHEDRRVPPARRERHRVRVPPHHPRRQTRIAEVVRHGGAERAPPGPEVRPGERAIDEHDHAPRERTCRRGRRAGGRHGHDHRTSRTSGRGAAGAGQWGPSSVSRATSVAVPGGPSGARS